MVRYGEWYAVGLIRYGEMGSDPMWEVCWYGEWYLVVGDPVRGSGVGADGGWYVVGGGSDSVWEVVR